MPVAMKTHALLRALFALCLCLASWAQAQPQLELLLPYDGTSRNFLIGRSLGYRAYITSFQRTANGLEFALQYDSSPNVPTVPELADLYIPLARFVPADEPLGDRLSVTIRYPSSSCVACLEARAEFLRHPSPARPLPPAESGWWVDFLRNQRRIGRGISIARAGRDVSAQLLTYPQEHLDPSLPQPSHPGIWLVGATRADGPYVAVPMRHYRGSVCLSCAFFSEGEDASPAGELILAFLSPTTAVLAPPNERARLIELAALPPDERPLLTFSLLTGRWSLLPAEDAAFGGIVVEFAPPVLHEQPRPSRFEHALSFAFGSGRAVCSSVGSCQIFLRFDGFDREFLYAEIPREGLGNRHLYVPRADGSWRVLATRID